VFCGQRYLFLLLGSPAAENREQKAIVKKEKRKERKKTSELMQTRVRQASFIYVVPQAMCMELAFHFPSFPRQADRLSTTLPRLMNLVSLLV
jgi:hypothetical protein